MCGEGEVSQVVRCELTLDASVVVEKRNTADPGVEHEQIQGCFAGD